MGLQMKRRFWEEDDRIFGGHLYLNLPFGNFRLPIQRLLRRERRLARLLRQRPDGRCHQHARARPHPARARACQQGAPADSRGVTKPAYCVFWDTDTVQHRRVRRWRWWGWGSACRARAARQPDLSRLCGRQRQRRLDGRGHRGRVETGEAGSANGSHVPQPRHA